MSGLVFVHAIAKGLDKPPITMLIPSNKRMESFITAGNKIVRVWQGRKSVVNGIDLEVYAETENLHQHPFHAGMRGMALNVLKLENSRQTWPGENKIISNKLQPRPPEKSPPEPPPKA